MIVTLKGIHEVGCIHMDLKLENVLCQNDEQGGLNYYICDFGSSINCPTNVSAMSKV